ncbi:RNA-binding protein [Alphaproteobacteria bacterium]|nr:RNA-binding protein [Alphaproteobacteria bacterium]
MHEISVNTKYYNLLKSGAKTVELRLFDDKRRAIAVGDAILFRDNANPADSFIAKVVALHRAADFSELCAGVPPAKAGFADKQELLAVMNSFYAQAEQGRFGVVGIEIAKAAG